ncbi:MAG: S49 family peptidase [Planctomycetota bacterium]
MRSLIFLALLACAMTGCQSRPLRVLMRGDVNGNMGVNGDVGIAGDLDINGNLSTSIKADNTASRLATVAVDGHSRSDRRIAVIDVDGLLVNQIRGGLGSLGENPVALFREKLRQLESDPTIAALVLRIDSPGGGVTATDVMSHELMRFKSVAQIPVVACLMTGGTGGAYYLATHADEIVAHPTSIVGGIGVILNLYNLEDTLGQYNIAAIPVKAGDKIDGGSPVRVMEKEEREVLQTMANTFHQRFINQVRTSRAAVAFPENSEWFDGRVVTGEAARQAGLVDHIGYLDDAIHRASQLAGEGPDLGVVMLRRDNDRAYTALDVTPNSSAMASLLPLSIPGLDRSELPTFMYLWQLEPSLANAK